MSTEGVRWSKKSPKLVNVVCERPIGLTYCTKHGLTRSHQLRCFSKGGLFSDSFSLWLKSPQNGAKNYPDHYSTKEKIFRIVI